MRPLNQLPPRPQLKKEFLRAVFRRWQWVKGIVGSCREATSDISYEVAGLAPNEFMRPEGTPDLHRPIRTVSLLQPASGTLCQVNFQRHSTLDLVEALGAFLPLRVGGVCGAEGERIPQKRSRFELLNHSQIHRRAIAKTLRRQSVAATAHSHARGLKWGC
jgi:hypothetical protein